MCDKHRHRMSEDAPAGFIIDDCPWCGADLEWLKEQADMNGAELRCRECNHPIRIRGRVVIHIAVEKVPWLASVPEGPEGPK